MSIFVVWKVGRIKPNTWRLSTVVAAFGLLLTLRPIALTREEAPNQRSEGTQILGLYMSVLWGHDPQHNARNTGMYYINVFSRVFFCSWTCKQKSSWLTDAHIRSMWSCDGDSEPTGTLGGFFMWCSSVRWISSPLIPPTVPRPTTGRGPWPGPVQRPGLSDLWHNANLCPPRREPPCAVASSSERALFSVAEMITEMGGRESELLCNLQRGEWPLREASDIAVLAAEDRSREGGSFLNYLVCYLVWQTGGRTK